MTGSQGNIWRAAFVNLELEKKIYQIRFKHSLPENSDCGFPPCPECNAMNKCPNANVAIAGIRLDCHKDAPKAPLETCRKREVPLAGCEILAVSPSSEGKSQITCMSCVQDYRAVVNIRELKQRRFWATHVYRKLPFFIFGRWFCPNFQSNRLYKSKETKQYKLHSVKGYYKGKVLTSGWRPLLKNVFA